MVRVIFKDKMITLSNTDINIYDRVEEFAQVVMEVMTLKKFAIVNLKNRYRGSIVEGHKIISIYIYCKNYILGIE